MLITDFSISENCIFTVPCQTLRDHLCENIVETFHPMTQGKIERWHRTMKNVVKLENYYSPSELKIAIARFVDYYNNERYHEPIGNVTPADMYYDRAKEILSRRQKIKKRTLKERRRLHRQQLLRV